MKMLQSKLRSCRGMSLTELLSAVLILSLVTSAIAVGISASYHVYRESVALSEMQLLSSTLSQGVMDELRYAREIDSSGTSVTFTSATYGSQVSFGQDRDGHITLGDRLLIGEGAYSKGAYAAEVTELTYHAGIFSVELSVFALMDAETAKTVTFSVAPLNPPLP